MASESKSGFSRSGLDPIRKAAAAPSSGESVVTMGSNNRLRDLNEQAERAKELTE
jgi:hypothetical protein